MHVRPQPSIDTVLEGRLDLRIRRRLRRTEDDVVLVPRRAVVEEEGRSYLYVVDGERAHRTEIIPGYRDESVLQVREGISAGARIVTEGVRELSDGARVEIYREVPVAEDPMTIDADG